MHKNNQTVFLFIWSLCSKHERAFSCLLLYNIWLPLLYTSGYFYLFKYGNVYLTAYGCSYFIRMVTSTYLHMVRLPYNIWLQLLYTNGNFYLFIYGNLYLTSYGYCYFIRVVTSTYLYTVTFTLHHMVTSWKSSPLVSCVWKFPIIRCVYESSPLSGVCIFSHTIHVKCMF